MGSSFVSKSNRNHYTAFILVLTLLAFAPANLFAENDPMSDLKTDDELEEELKYLKAETFVITASRILENIKKAPASITVVTAKQIRQMGARNLLDVLQAIPGYDHYYAAYTGVYQIRARRLGNWSSGRYLFMVNSLPLNENWSGGAMVTHATIMLENVKRIEFIRGPGSALYGANAFSGVVNIITKEAEDIDGLEVTARGGSYDTQQYNVLFGKDLNGLETVFNFNYFNTDGFDGFIETDSQTLNDQLSGTSASQAPGRMNMYEKKYDAALSLKYKGIRFDGRYVDRNNSIPLGIYVLHDKSSYDFVDYYLNLSYERTFWKGIDFFAKLYRTHNDRNSISLMVPGGAYQPWLGIAPTDLFRDHYAKNNRTGFEIQANYKISDMNTLVAGITYEEMEQYDVELHSNFLYSGVIFPSVQNNSDVWNHNRAVKRNFKAIFFEDIWDITEDLRLTTGARYDHYSDFGGHFSPRVGLTWEFIKGYDLKLLYGHAFRAPAFAELYDTPYGNADLGPETVDTYELSLGAEITPSLSGRLTMFRNDLKDGISVTAIQGTVRRNTNHREVKSDGFEIAFKYDFRRGNYLAVNYTYQTIDILQEDLREMQYPIHMGNIMANIRLSKHLNFNTSCHLRGGYERQIGDPRDDVSGNAIFNATLIAKKFLRGFEELELRASVYNLFDKDFVEPSALSSLPDDIPMPGRNFMLGLRYTF